MSTVLNISDKSYLRAGLMSTLAEVLQSAERMTAEQFVTPIEEAKWSPGQHIGHLLLSTAPITQALQMPKAVLAEKFGTNNRTEWNDENLREKYTEILATGSLKAPFRFVMNDVRDVNRATLIGDFAMEIENLVSQMDKWLEADLSTYVLPHPAFGLLTMREMILFTSLHTRHHLRAIQSIFHK